MDAATIVNMCVGELGDLTEKKRMTAFSRSGCGNSTALHVAYDFYQPSKEEMLAAAAWQGTRKVKALTVSADDPVLSGKWTYKYVRPPDCLLLLAVTDTSGNEYDYELVNEEDAAGKNVRWIYCNEADMLARYVLDVGEETYLPGMAQYHALCLAAHVAATAVRDKANAAIFLRTVDQRKREALALGLKETYIPNERGSRAYTDLY